MRNKPGYDQKYQKENIVQKKVVFNRQSEEDITMLNWVELQENFNAYCKGLIRADMREKGTEFSYADP